jgi:leader peptidase (prepilin peptidase)/N-methyltransferase
MYVLYGVVFVFGALFGSFSNVCIYRIPRRHFMLTGNDLERLAATEQHQKAPIEILTLLKRFLLGLLRFFGLHPGSVDVNLPAAIRERLTAMQDRDFVTLNDFADALELHFTEEEVRQYGDAILQKASQQPESIVLPASHCPQCQTPIKPWDNIPILSYLILRGRCRTCGARISWRYPFVELLTAALYVGVVWRIGLVPAAVVYMAFASLLVILSGIDLDHQLLPDVLTIAGIVLGLIMIPVFPISWQDSLLGLLTGGGLIWGVGFLGKLIFRKEAMGGGDIKLLAMIGVFLGWKMVFLTVFFASISGAFIGIIIKLSTGKDYIPFGPFLSLGALLSFYVGPLLLNWYGGLLNQFFFL